MDYLLELSLFMGEDNSDTGPLFNLYSDNKIWRYFKSKGYKYIFVGSYWEHGDRSEFADINYEFKSIGLSGFSRSFLETTMFYPMLNSIVSNPYLEWRKLHHDLSIDQFEKLEAFSTFKGPKYVFAHLYLTHSPYVFDKSGKMITAEEEKDFVNFYSQVINAQSLLGKHSIGSKVLPLLERTTNQRMFFKSMSLTIPERKIVLEGVADSYETIASQLANYEATPEIERVVITAMQSSSTDGKVYFTANMLVAPSVFRDIIQSQ